MLIAADVRTKDPAVKQILELLGNKDTVTELMVGVYTMSGFGGTHMLRDFEHYPEFEPGKTASKFEDYRGSYGVCDSLEQLLEVYPELENSDRKFVVTMSEVIKANQPVRDGWRWHKWGNYIGSHEIQCEYLYNEKDIESVWVYHIYEKL